MKTPKNQYEAAARLRKISRLVGTLDAHLQGAGCNPYSDQAARVIAGLTDEQWAEAARRADCNEASITTREAVIALYNDRPEHVRAVAREHRWCLHCDRPDAAHTKEQLEACREAIEASRYADRLLGADAADAPGAERGD